MGLTTYWFGRVDVTPSMDDAAVDALEALHRSRELPAGRNGWIASQDRTAVVWDRHEKFNDGLVWLQYLLDHPLVDHYGHGEIIGVCTVSGDEVRAQRITVNGREAFESAAYYVPDTELRSVEISDVPAIDDIFYWMSEIDAQQPDYVAAAAELDEWVAAVAGPDALGDLGRLLNDLVALLGRPEPLATAVQAHFP